MNVSSIGDLSHSFMMRQRQADLKTDMLALQTEVTTGHAADTRKHLGGDFAHLSDIERSISMLDTYRFAINEAETMTLAMQSALGTIQDVSSDLSSGLLLAAQSGARQGLATVSADAEHAFSAIVSQLNGQVATRSLFSGAAYDTAALATGEEMLAALRTAVAGETTLTGVQSALDTWFDMPGGGFETDGYLGSTTDGTPLQLSDDVRVGLSLRADDTVFRNVLKATAMAALAGDEASGFSPDLQSSMVARAGTDLIELQPDLTDRIAGLGLVQSRIDDNKVRNEAASLTLEMSRNALLGIDPYESATRLDQVQSQIEALYAVTVRASRLSLLDFMR
ncbi:MAG: flagellar biosynthesis protein FlgL [Rhodobacteraceae bacterium]|nr:MAG: flagellar biosynthesis protein FlgL [Paracoccaceae bacterium]